MDDAEVEGQVVEIEDFIVGVALGAEHLVNRGEVRARLHFDVGVALAVEDVHVLRVLQESSQHGDRLLVVEHRPVHQVGGYIGGGVAVGDQVGVVGVFIVHHVGDHHIADAPVEGGCLAEDVHAAHFAHMVGDLAEDIVRRHPQGVIDVEDQSLAVPQEVQPVPAQAAVHPFGADFGEVDDLGIHIEVVFAVHAGDAASPLVRLTDLPEAAPIGGLHVLLQQVVEKILLAGGYLAALDVAPLVLQINVLAFFQVADERVAVFQGEAGEQVDDAVRVAGDEVNGTLAQGGAGGFDVIPPGVGCPAVLAERSVEQADAEARRTLLETRHVGCEIRPPDALQAFQVIQRDADGLRQFGAAFRGAHVSVEIRTLGQRLELVVQFLPLDLQGGQHRHNVVDIGLAGDHTGQGAFTVEEAPPPPGAGLDHLPGLHIRVSAAGENRRTLPHDHRFDLKDALRHAQQRVDESRHIQERFAGVRVQQRIDPGMSLLQGENLHLGGGAQQGVVCAQVKFNFFRCGVRDGAFHTLIILVFPALLQFA